MFVSWDVEFTDEFEEWWDTLEIEEQAALSDRVRLLEEQGPTVKRPVVGEITGSRHDPQMKEMRVGTLRVLFMFDPHQTAILLVGGNKAGQWNAWYRTAIPEADDLYDEYLDDLRKEGLI